MPAPSPETDRPPRGRSAAAARAAGQHIEFHVTGMLPAPRLREPDYPYLYRDVAFPWRPAALNGADWVQAANSDARYSAVDLMEIAVVADTVILIAHDDRLPRPAWLTDRFNPTDWQITIGGQTMHLFSHRAERDESLTLGPNASEGTARTGNMYVVFVNRLPQGHADVANRSVEQNPLAVTK